MVVFSDATTSSHISFLFLFRVVSSSLEFHFPFYLSFNSPILFAVCIFCLFSICLASSYLIPECYRLLVRLLGLVISSWDCFFDEGILSIVGVVMHWSLMRHSVSLFSRIVRFSQLLPVDWFALRGVALIFLVQVSLPLYNFSVMLVRLLFIWLTYFSLCFIICLHACTLSLLGVSWILKIFWIWFNFVIFLDI